MGFLEAVIRALIGLLLIALAFFLIVYVLAAIGVVLPSMVILIFKLIVGLIAILYLVRLFAPFVGGFTLFPPGPPRPPGT